MIVKKLITVLVISMSLLCLLLSGCNGKVTPSGQSFEVKRGDLDIVVSTNGSLTMPNNFDLRFGTTGKVQEILVKEGDRVREGSILAFLDNTAQKNALRTALFNIRSAVNNIAVACNDKDLPNSYPELSAPRVFQEARKDLDEFISYFSKGQYKDAGYKLGMAYFDIQVCEDLLKSRLDPAVLAGVKSNSDSIYYPDGNAGTSIAISSNDATVIDYLQKYQQRLMFISQLMMTGAYEKIKPELAIIQQETIQANQLVENAVRLRGRSFLTYSDIPTSLDFLQASLRSLQDLDAYIAHGAATPEEIARKIYIAKLNLSIGSDILENQTLTYEWTSASNWKTLQQYNLSMQTAEIAFYKAKQDIMKTVIISPSDGVVVSVDLKKDYVLSAQDYSVRTAIKLVDTRTIKFTGLVDEIDIIKVAKGQKARITIDAVPNKVFTGTVTFISPFGTKVGQVIKFAVTIELDSPGVELRGGLSATADINVFTARNILLVPISAIVNTPSGPVATVIDEATGQTEQRKLTLGKQNFQFAEVIAGLKEGDKVQVSNVKPTGTSTPRPPGMPMPPR